MAVVLAATWHPRGELERLLRLSDTLHRLYAAVRVVLPPDAETKVLSQLVEAGIVAETASVWAHGRHAALRAGVESRHPFIQYADMDRLVRWLETRPDELEATIRYIEQVDFLLIGRTPEAYASHPEALIQTEAITNTIFSYMLGFGAQVLDFSAGSKGFSQRAASHVLEKSPAGHALGTDSQWAVLLKQGGFKIDYTEVNGLDWESADRYQDQAATLESQRKAAAEYDADPMHWAHRVRVAQEITRSGLSAVAHE